MKYRLSMGESANNTAILRQRISELEREREELQKDVEQLCMQQSGTGYIGVITRIQAQRAASFEKEIETLKNKLAACVRDNHNLQEELSEVYHIKSQLADLHKVELEKNHEAEQQIKFFQSSIAAAFAERDRALMEAERAYQNEEQLSDKVSWLETRIEEITEECSEKSCLCDELKSRLQDSTSEISRLKQQCIEQAQQCNEMRASFEESAAEISILKQNCSEQRCLCNELKSNLEDARTEISKLKQDYIEQSHLCNKLRSCLEESTTETLRLKQVVEKFYKIRQTSLGISDDEPNEFKAECLIQDPIELWTFDRVKAQHACAKHTMKKSLEIILKEVSLLRSFHAENEKAIKAMLKDDHQWWETTVTVIAKLLIKADIQKAASVGLSLSTEDSQITWSDNAHNDSVIGSGSFRVSHQGKKVEDDSLSCSGEEQRTVNDTEKALEQALQEKVQALLLLSQQEERHLLEKNTNAALEEKIKELQQKLFQVTNEKVAALMEIAQLRQNTNSLLDLGRSMEQNYSSTFGGAAIEKDLKGRNLLTGSLKQWFRRIDIKGFKASAPISGETGSTTSKSKETIDFARLKVENASLQENMSTLGHLTAAIHKLRLSLLRTKDNVKSSASVDDSLRILEDIITEARHIKTALGSSLPVSWSAEGSKLSYPWDSEKDTAGGENQEVVPIDSISATGFELVELVILAAELQKVELMHMSVNPVNHGEVSDIVSN